MELAKRLKDLPPYLFADLDNQKKIIQKKGADIIDLSIGDPDLEPSDKLVGYLKEALNKKQVHRYPDYIGCKDFRDAASAWLKTRHNADVDPDSEVISLIGSKEGIAHIIWAFVNPGDVVIVPSPGYPVYFQSTTLAGGTVYSLPLNKKQGFVPDFTAIPEDVLKKAKMIFLNYPNNPTSACVTKECFEKAIELAKKYDLIICHDAAYIEIYDGNDKPISILSIPGAKDVAVEFHSFSKTFSICGWRIAFAAGNKDILKGLAKMKQNLDSGAFRAVELAVASAMTDLSCDIERINKIYAERRKIFKAALETHGFKVLPSNDTFYLWSEIPNGENSVQFCKNLLEKAAIAATPGVGFGAGGEGFVRFSLTSSTERLHEAAKRIAKL